PIQQGAEVTVSESVGGHQGGGDGSGFASAPAFVVEKEERAVAAIVEFWDPNRSAKNRAELILAERGLLHTRRAGRREIILEEAFGIKLVVADEVVGRAVKIVGARPHYHDQLYAGVESVLCRVAAGENLHFRHGFGRRRERHRVDPSFGGNDAVKRGVLAHLALAVGNQSDALAGNGDAPAGTRHAVVPVARAERNAGIEHGKV